MRKSPHVQPGAGLFRRRPASSWSDDGSEASLKARSVSNGFQITRVGMWYCAGCLVVGLAATNTGNNGLFLAVAMMTASLLVVDLLGRVNVARLGVRLVPPAEIFANRQASFGVELENRLSLLGRRLLIVSVRPDDVRGGDPGSEGTRRYRAAPWLLPQLKRADRKRGRLELILPRRGPRTIRAVEVTSLFPIGAFRKGRRYRQDLDILVYPELFHPPGEQREEAGSSGERAVRRLGQGQELYALREYKPGDDPRGIHWKQSARQGGLIFQQRAQEDSRRLRVVFDNAVGDLETDEEKKRFEHLVSEAATSAVDHLARGFEVALVTRDVVLPYAAGPRQRQNILEALARVEAVPEAAGALTSELERSGDLRLAMEKAS